MSGAPKAESVNSMRNEQNKKYVKTSVQDESGCWICGGFTRDGTKESTWSCYICAGKCTEDSKTTKLEYSWCFGVPFCYATKDTAFDKATNKYHKEDVTSISWSPFHYYCDFSRRIPSIMDYCRGDVTYGRKTSYGMCIPGICCKTSEKFKTNGLQGYTIHNNKLYFPCAVNSYGYDDGKKESYNTSSWWSCCTFSSNKVARKTIEDKIIEDDKSDFYCCSPFSVIHKKTNNALSTTRSAYGLLPVMCVRQNNSEREICGTIGVLSCCHKHDFTSDKSNSCVTACCGIGYCKYGRCCKLYDKYQDCSPDCMNCCRYVNPLEYEFIGKIDMNLKTSSMTCFGVGNCEIVPLQDMPGDLVDTSSNIQPQNATTISIVPQQQIMSAGIGKDVPIVQAPEGFDVVPANAHYRMHVRSIAYVGKTYF